MHILIGIFVLWILTATHWGRKILFWGAITCVAIYIYETNQHPLVEPSIIVQNPTNCYPIPDDRVELGDRIINGCRY